MDAQATAEQENRIYFLSVTPWKEIGPSPPMAINGRFFNKFRKHTGKSGRFMVLMALVRAIARVVVNFGCLHEVHKVYESVSSLSPKFKFLAPRYDLIDCYYEAVGREISTSTGDRCSPSG